MNGTKYRILRDRIEGMRVYRPQKKVMGIYWKDLVRTEELEFAMTYKEAEEIIHFESSMRNSKMI